MDLVFKTIKKVNEFLDPEIIGQDEVVTLRNMILDSQGAKAVKRGGYNAFNTNSAGGGIYSLYDANTSAGTNYVIGVMGTTLVKSQDGTGTWSAFKTGLTSNKKMRIVNYNNKLYCTNGTDAPFSSDLTSNYAVTVAAPTVSGIGTANGTATGLTANSKYYWRLAFVTNTGESSIVSLPFTHSAYGTINATANTTTSTVLSVNFTSLPVSADTRVVSRRLYRTQANGTVFYLAATLDNVSTTFTDNIPDTSLDLSITYDVITTPSVSRYVLAHKERVFYAYNTIPDAVPEQIYSNTIIVGSAGAGLPAGTYYYKRVYKNSEGKVSVASGEVHTTLAGGGSIALGNLGGILDPDTDQRIYRSTDNVTYYYVGSATGFTFFDDGITATSETLPSATSSSTTYNCSIVYSEIGKPAQLNAFNIIQIYPDDGDEITGIIDDGDAIKVFKRNSIYRLNTIGNPLNWSIYKQVSQIGCDEPDSLQAVGERIYFRNNKQLYRFPDKINLPVSQEFKTTCGSFTLKDSCYSNYNQWYLMFGTISATSVALVYDEKIDTFYYFSTGSAVALECGLEKKLGSSKGTLLLGSNATNYLLKYDTSTIYDYAGSDANYDITTVLRTKTYTLNEPNSLIRLRILYADYKKQDSLDVVHLIVNPQDATQITSTDDVNSTITSDYKNYKIVTDAMTGTLKTPNKFYYQVTNAAEFNGLKLEYRIINRGKR